MKDRITDKLNEVINDVLFMRESNIALIAQLRGSCFKIQFTDLPVSIYLVFTETEVQVLNSQPKKALDACLKGSVVNLIGAGVFKKVDRIEITGDLLKADKLAKLLSQIELPVNEIVANNFGKEFSYVLGSVKNGLGRFIDSASEGVKENFENYVNYELGVCVQDHEFFELKQRVNRVRDRVAKLEKEIEAKNEDNNF